MEKEANIKSGNPQECLSLPPYGILIQSHRHSYRFRIAQHRHPYHSLLYIVSGQGNCLIDKHSHQLVPNTAIFLRKNHLHQLADKPGRAMVVFVVYFSDQLADTISEMLQPLFDLPVPLPVPAHQAQHIRRSLRRMLHEQDTKPIQFQTAIEQTFSSIILELFRRSQKVSLAEKAQLGRDSFSRAEKVLEYVAEQYYESQSLAGAAGMAHLSTRQFTNICRRISGRSFAQYVNDVRTKRAAELLKSTDMPVSAIAFEVGFEELSTFYRAFKKRHATSPLAFRATHRTC